MQFHTLVDKVRHLSLPEKQEMRSLLDRFVAEERRREISAHHRESQRELDRGELEFSSDPGRLRDLLEV